MLLLIKDYDNRFSHKHTMGSLELECQWIINKFLQNTALIASVMWHYSIYGIQEYLDSFLGGHLVGSNKC